MRKTLIATVCALLGALGLAAVPQVGLAQEGVSILIDSVKPGVLTPTSKLKIKGRVFNRSPDPITGTQVQLRTTGAAIRTRSGLADFVAQPSTSLSLAYGVTTSVADTVAPGESTPFRISVPVTSLPFGSAGIYPIGVGAVSNQLTSDVATTVLPWVVPSEDISASGLAFLWPIAVQPNMAAKRLVVDPELPMDFLPDGRLSNLIRSASGAAVVPVLDAATAQIGKELSTGYDVLGPAGAEPGDLEQAIGPFLSLLTELQADTSAQFAIADVDALEAGNLKDLVVRSVTEPEIVLKETINDEANLLVVPPGGALSEPALDRLVNAGARSLLLSETAYPPAAPLSYTPTGFAESVVTDDTVGIFLADDQLSQTLSRSLATAENRSLVRQLVLADTALVALERPSDPRQVIARPKWTWDPPEDWARSLVRTLERAPWVDLVGLAQVAEGEQIPREKRVYSQQQAKKQLPSSYIKDAKRISRSIATMRSIVDDPAGFSEPFTTALQRTVSGLYRGKKNKEARRLLLATLDAQVAAEKDKVKVVSNGSVTLSGDTGRLPITVANDFGRTVTVRLELRAAEDFRLEYDPPPPLTIEAGEKSGTEIPVKVAGSQPLVVDVVLTDKGGRFYSKSAQLEINSTGTTQIAAAVVALGALGFFGLGAVRFWRRRRRHD